MFQAYFHVLLVGGGELITIEDPSLSALGYQLSLATSQWVIAQNLMFQAYFEVFYSLL